MPKSDSNILVSNETHQGDAQKSRVAEPEHEIIDVELFDPENI